MPDHSARESFVSRAQRSEHHLRSDLPAINAPQPSQVIRAIYGCGWSGVV